MVEKFILKESAKEYITIYKASRRCGLSVLQLYSLICNNLLEYKIFSGETYINYISLSGWILANNKVSEELKKSYTDRNISFSFAEYLKYNFCKNRLK